MCTFHVNRKIPVLHSFLFTFTKLLLLFPLSQELNSRSRVVEDAVLELIELVLVGVEGGGQGDQGSYSFLTANDLDDATDLDDSRSG